MQFAIEEGSDTRAKASTILIVTERGGAKHEGDGAVVSSVDLVEFLASQTENSGVNGAQHVKQLQVDLGGKLDEGTRLVGAWDCVSYVI